MDANLIKEWGLVRIDDRLIHGQVLAVWAKSKKFSIIQIIDDSIAADPFLVDVMRLSAPTGLQIIAESLEKSKITLLANAIPQETMLLMRNPNIALQLNLSGIPFRSLNIGGLGMSQGRKNVFRNFYLSIDEYNALKILHNQGVRITFQTVPGENSREFSEIPELC